MRPHFLTFLVCLTACCCFAEDHLSLGNGTGKKIFSATFISWEDFKQRGALADDGGLTVGGINLAELMALADRGHTPSQCLLARLFYTGNQGLPENKVEADKWALIASTKVKSASHLVKEFELFMKADEIRSAKESAAKFIKNHGVGGGLL